MHLPDALAAKLVNALAARDLQQFRDALVKKGLGGIQSIVPAAPSRPR